MSRSHWLVLILCVVFGLCEEDEDQNKKVKCERIYLCSSSQFPSWLDVGSDSSNECEDYMIKCCPKPDSDEDDSDENDRKPDPEKVPVGSAGMNVVPVVATGVAGASAIANVIKNAARQAINQPTLESPTDEIELKLMPKHANEAVGTITPTLPGRPATVSRMPSVNIGNNTSSKSSTPGPRRSSHPNVKRPVTKPLVPETRVTITPSLSARPANIPRVPSVIIGNNTSTKSPAPGPERSSTPTNSGVRNGNVDYTPIPNPSIASVGAGTTSILGKGIVSGTGALAAGSAVAFNPSLAVPAVKITPILPTSLTYVPRIPSVAIRNNTSTKSPTPGPRRSSTPTNSEVGNGNVNHNPIPNPSIASVGAGTTSMLGMLIVSAIRVLVFGSTVSFNQSYPEPMKKIAPILPSSPTDVSSIPSDAIGNNTSTKLPTALPRRSSTPNTSGARNGNAINSPASNLSVTSIGVRPALNFGTGNVSIVSGIQVLNGNAVVSNPPPPAPVTNIKPSVNIGNNSSTKSPTPCFKKYSTSARSGTKNGKAHNIPFGNASVPCVEVVEDIMSSGVEELAPPVNTSVYKSSMVRLVSKLTEIVFAFHDQSNILKDDKNPQKNSIFKKDIIHGKKSLAGSRLAVEMKIATNRKCGLRNVNGVGFRITGDNDGESEYGEFPWMVAIIKEEKAIDQVINLYQCGGSLIHPSVVLTAAQCVQNKKPSEIKVRLGEWDTQTKNEMFDHQDRNVVEIVSHAEFYKGGLFNDVALLFLEKPATIMETVNTICLPPADFNFDMSRCFASGWGKDVFGKQGTYQVILKKIELPIMPRADCQKALRTTRLGHRFKLHSSFICAGGEKGRDTCKGDGGSPLICPIPGSVNHYYQAGMVAWGIGCGEDGIPGVYVNVPMFRSWIDDNLTQRNISHTSYIYD